MRHDLNMPDKLLWTFRLLFESTKDNTVCAFIRHTRRKSSAESILRSGVALVATCPGTVRAFTVE